MTGEITITDRNAQIRRLFIMYGTLGDDDPFLELPPRAPEGVLDVRFAGDRAGAQFDDRKPKEAAIEISSATYPLTVTWNLTEHVRGLRLVVDAQKIDIDQLVDSATMQQPKHLRQGQGRRN